MKTDIKLLSSDATKNQSLAVRLNGLTKRFRKTTVVKEISLEIPYGNVYGLIGPNGAGKSTTLKMLMNMLSISGGSATVLGQDVASGFQTVKQRIGYVPETHHMYRWMKVKRLIRFVSSMYENWSDERCAEMLDLFELDREKRVRELSKGMQAKLALLLAVCHEPELLILDEPMSGLDPIVREEFIDGVLKVICDREATVIFSSHTIGDIQRLADSVGIIDNGTLLINQPVGSLLEDFKRIEATLPDGFEPSWYPESTVFHQLEGRNLSVTVSDFSPCLLEQLVGRNQVIHYSVEDMNLDRVFKDVIHGRKKRGQRSRSQTTQQSLKVMG